MRLPTSGALRGTWGLDSLETEDGHPIAWVGLQSSLFSTGGKVLSQGGQQTLEDDNQQILNPISNTILGTQEVEDPFAVNSDSIGNSEEEGGARNMGGASNNSAQKIDAFPGGDPIQRMQLDPTEQDLADASRSLYSQTDYRFDIIAVLPRPVPVGERIKIRIKWSARWQFAHFNVAGDVIQSVNSSTGMKEYLPEILPLRGGTKWDFETVVGAPARSSWLRSQKISASGDTIAYSEVGSVLTNASQANCTLNSSTAVMKKSKVSEYFSMNSR